MRGLVSRPIAKATPPSRCPIADASFFLNGAADSVGCCTPPAAHSDSEPLRRPRALKHREAGGPPACPPTQSPTPTDLHSPLRGRSPVPSEPTGRRRPTAAFAPRPCEDHRGGWPPVSPRLHPDFNSSRERRLRIDTASNSTLASLFLARGHVREADADRQLGTLDNSKATLGRNVASSGKPDDSRDAREKVLGDRNSGVTIHLSAEEIPVRER
jgi:hypothetical protein